MKTLQQTTRTLPAYWASYLINGDDSGLTNELERSKIDDFLHREGLPMPVSCSDESYFKWGNDASDLGGDVLEYTFLLPNQ